MRSYNFELACLLMLICFSAFFPLRWMPFSESALETDIELLVRQAEMTLSSDWETSKKVSTSELSISYSKMHTSPDVSQVNSPTLYKLLDQEVEINHIKLSRPKNSSIDSDIEIFKIHAKPGAIVQFDSSRKTMDIKICRNYVLDIQVRGGIEGLLQGQNESKPFAIDFPGWNKMRFYADSHDDEHCVTLSIKPDGTPLTQLGTFRISELGYRDNVNSKLSTVVSGFISGPKIRHTALALGDKLDFGQLKQTVIRSLGFDLESDAVELRVKAYTNSINITPNITDSNPFKLDPTVFSYLNTFPFFIYLLSLVSFGGIFGFLGNPSSIKTLASNAYAKLKAIIQGLFD